MRLLLIHIHTMSTIIGLFKDSKMAGAAVGELKNQGYTDHISVVGKDVNKMGVEGTDVKQDLTDGAVTGATTGAVLGALGALLVGAASFVLPGVGLIAMGPLATLLAGTAGGAVAGGVTGALVDWGIPEEKAKEFEHKLESGEVLVAVTADEGAVEKVQQVMMSNQADDTFVTEK